ncbi:MAG: hypothetical protein AAGC93_16685 [Cyanobacteria bacterium P01_F01_bin.53]
MGLFSFFGKPADDVAGSYCDTESESDVEFYASNDGGDDIEDQLQSAHDRNDNLHYGEEDFTNTCVHQRYDDDARQIEQGPREYGPQKRWYQL